MPKFVIERDLPGAGDLTADDLQAISQKSVEVLDSMAGRAQWLASYVTADKPFCGYLADDAGDAREHARVHTAGPPAGDNTPPRPKGAGPKVPPAPAALRGSRRCRARARRRREDRTSRPRRGTPRARRHLRGRAR